MDNNRTATFVRYGLMAVMAASLLGVYTQLPPVSLALQAAVFALASVHVAAGCRAWNGSRLLGWAALALSLLMGASALFSLDRGASLMALGQWIAYGVMAWLVASVFRPAKLGLLAQYLLLLGLLMAGLAVYFYWGEIGRTSLPVMNSIFGNKNHLGGYLLLLLPLSLALYLEARSGRDRLAYGLAAVFMGSVFILTYSRGAWFAILPAIAIVAWAFRKRPAVLFGKLAAAAAGTLLVALLVARGSLGGSIDLGYQGALTVARAAVDGEAQGTLAPRLDYWQGAFRIMLEHPLAGSGLATFDALFPSYQLDPLYFSRFAHNFFLQMGAEAGVPALLAILVLFGLLAAAASRAYRQSGGPDGMPLALGAGLSAGLVASALHNLVELDWYIPAIGLLFALEAGLVLRTAWPPLSVPQRSRLLVSTALCALLFMAASWQWSGQALLNQAKDPRDPLTSQGQLELASRVNPLDGEPHFRLAELHLAQYEATESKSELEAAVASARAALARSPARDAYRVLLASLYLSAGMTDLAVEEMEHLARRLQPLQAPQVYQRLGEAYLRTGRTQEALSTYLRLVAGFPQGPDTPQPPQPGALTLDEAAALLSEAHLALGNIAAGEGSLQKAEEEYTESFSLDPGNAPTSFNLGLLMYHQGRWAESLVRFQWASSLDPKFAPAHYYRGLAHLKLGLRDRASTDFMAALSVDPDYQDARRALEAL